MWISIEKNSARQVLRSPHCGVLSYLFYTTELINCKYLNIVRYPIPGDPTATALSSSSISLSWINTSSIYGISIERRTASTEFTEIARGTAGETSYTDEGLDPATQYFYRVRYYNGLEAYHPSGEDDATTEEAAPETEEIKYGRLYNWYAATDVREIAADGWHVPTRAEFLTLTSYLGGDTVAGGKVKETGTTYWNSPNTGATNEVGFNAKGAGARNSSADFVTLLTSSSFWTSTALNGTNSYYSSLLYNLAWMLTNAGTLNIAGFSIRLIKDSTTLSDGESGSYTGNDGKVYRTICIGTQEWLADNLAETKFRNGDDIPIVTDNTAWMALTTAGMCSYDNDDNNI